MEPYEDPTHEWNGPQWHTGKKCIEPGCTLPAGTRWGDWWCQKHNAERIRRIDKNLAEILASYEAKHAASRPSHCAEGGGVMDDTEFRSCETCGEPQPADGDMSKWRDCDKCGGVFCSEMCWALDVWKHNLDDEVRSAAGIET